MMSGHIIEKLEARRKTCSHYDAFPHCLNVTLITLVYPVTALDIIQNIFCVFQIKQDGFNLLQRLHVL